MTNPNRDQWNTPRFDPRQQDGHYESWFLRANHPARPLAFWIRYTIFSPRRRPQQSVGELWAVYFDGESRQVSAARQEFPLSACQFGRSGLNIKIGGAWLSDGKLEGGAASGRSRLSWALRYRGGGSPLLLLPERLYSGGFPRAKALVGAPGALFNGYLHVAGRQVQVDEWPGSQNHNWGSRHTDRYAWGQVAGFDQAPDAFLELSTARVRLGPLWTPWLTPLVLRLDGQEYAINSLLRSAISRGRFAWEKPDFTWHFEAAGGGVRLHGLIHAPAERFAGLRYANPPGGEKICLNTKLASCELALRLPGGQVRTLTSQHRAAFEILQDTPHPAVEVLV